MNAVAFSFDDYEELNHDQLVEVNGGCGGNKSTVVFMNNSTTISEKTGKQ